MKSKADNPKTRDRQSGNRYFIDNAFLKTWGAKLGPHCIAVYNVLVMHANADSQTAFPSFQTIADMTGMSRRQAVREIEKLKTNNIIRVEERTAIAPDTGKSYFLSNIFTLLHPDEWVKIDQSLHEPSDTQSLGVVSDSHQPSDTQSPPLVTQSHPNNTNPNKPQLTTKEKTPPKGGGKPPITKHPELSRQMFTALAKVCKIDLTVLTSKTRGELNQNECALRNGDVTPADLSALEIWWYDHDWRGKQNQPPTPKQVIDVLGQFRDWRGQQAERAKGWETPPDPIPPPARTPEQLIWQQVLADSPQIPQWLAAEIKPITRSNGTFKLAVSSDSAKQWIDNRLVKVIKPTLNRIDQSISEIEVIVQ